MNRNVLVIGAYGAVGTKTCDLLNSKGFQVYKTSSSQETKISERLFHLNLQDRNSIESISGLLPELDSIVICAGKEPQQNLKDMEWNHFEEMISIHYRGPLWLVKQLRQKLKKDSSIVFISSVAANKGSYDPTYASLKAAVNGLVKTLARELAPNTSVSAVAPGLIVDSPVFDRMTENFKQKHRDANLTDSLLTPEEVANAILFCIENKQFTGQILNLNGGQYFGN